MSETFTKLFGSITDSTIWAEDNETRLVWITMLAMADQHGYVGASLPGLAHRARVDLAATERAIAKLLAPDPYSRSPEYEGRRIEVDDRGWTILNYGRFRDMRDEEIRREYERNRKRAQRARPEMSRDVPDSPAMSAQAEADTEADQDQDPALRAERAENEKPNVKVLSALASKLLPKLDPGVEDGDFAEELKAHAARRRLVYDGRSITKAVAAARGRHARTVRA